MEIINHKIYNPETAVEKEKPSLVSRVFMLQSATSEKIQQKLESGTHIADLNFVYNIMALKANVSEAKNPNQLMPVGGRIDLKKEKLRGGTGREMEEEAYLRPMPDHPDNNINQPGKNQPFKNMFK